MKLPAAFPAILVGVGLLGGLDPVAGAPRQPAPWEKPQDIPTESEFFRDRLAQPQNHFLLDGLHGFISGAEFYQARGEATPFLWVAHPYLRLRPDRRWTADSAGLVFRARVGNEVGDAMMNELLGPEAVENRTPYTEGGVSWKPLEALRLYAALDQNDHFSYRTYPDRLRMVGEDKRDKFSWIGDNLPPKSQVQLGGSWDRRGSRMEFHFNQGWWWTASPVSGRVYPWEGLNTDLLYQVGDGFDLSLMTQQWEIPLKHSFLTSRWRRSELSMGFPGTAPGGWLLRLELGFQRRMLESDSALGGFEKSSYPWSFRYRQDFEPDAVSFLKVLTRGSVGVRDRQVSVQHGTELRETWGPHQPAQGLKVYYRHPFTDYTVPTEFFPQDSTLRAEARPGKHSRGYALSTGYAYRRSTFAVGLDVQGAQEWEAPVFHLESLDSAGTAHIRSGFYAGSDHALYNGSAKLFAEGGLGEKLAWNLGGGLRGFQGDDAEAMEYLPSPWWMDAGAGWSFPSDLRLEGRLRYLGPKEVRGWGPVFRVPSHFENDFALVQSLFAGRMKLTCSALHAFGEPVLEHPNGNPLRFRILAGMEGAF